MNTHDYVEIIHEAIHSVLKERYCKIEKIIVPSNIYYALKEEYNVYNVHNDLTMVFGIEVAINNDNKKNILLISNDNYTKYLTEISLRGKSKYELINEQIQNNK